MKILLHTLKGARVVETENIIYCKANGHYTNICLFETGLNDDDNYFISTKLLKEIEEVLPKNDFYRCHRSFLINLLYFIEFDVSTNSIILENGIEIKIAKNKKSESKKRLLSHIKKYNSFKKQYYLFKKRYPSFLICPLSCFSTVFAFLIQNGILLSCRIYSKKTLSFNRTLN